MDYLPVSRNTRQYTHLIINSDPVRNILSCDMAERIAMKWDLHNVNDFVPPETEVTSDDFLTVKQGSRLAKKWYSSMIEECRSIVRKYDAARHILEKYHGNICIAGGFPSSEHGTGSTDLDFFFYGMDQDEATIVLKDCVNIIATTPPDILSSIPILIGESAPSHGDPTITISRQVYLTTVNVSLPDIGYHRKYQFIHRLYPRMDMIIGGFDIGACMVLYDGVNAYMTNIGYWTWKNRTIIADISRCSTSFLHRLVKYGRRGFTIVFPGYTRTVMAGNNTDRWRAYRKIKELMEENGLQFAGGWAEYDYCGMNNGDIGCLSSRPRTIVVQTSSLKIKNCGGSNKLTPIWKSEKAFYHPTVADMSDYGNTSFLGELGFYNSYSLACGNAERVVSRMTIGKYWQSYTQTILDVMCKDPKIKTVEGTYPYYICGTREPLPKESMIERFRSIEWVVDNPQRQWTSSFNPVILNPIEFYGEKYRSFLVGLTDDEYVGIRLLKRKWRFDRHIMKIIILEVMKCDRFQVVEVQKPNLMRPIGRPDDDYFRGPVPFILPAYAPVVNIPGGMAVQSNRLFDNQL